MLKAARAQGRPMMVMAMMTAATIQASAIQTPPKTSHNRLSRTDTGDMGFLPCFVRSRPRHHRAARASCRYRQAVPPASVRLDAGLLLLRQHKVLGLEVLPRMGDQLPVARMIHGFDADDGLHQQRMMLMNVFDEFGLGVGRSRDQNRA